MERVLNPYEAGFQMLLQSLQYEHINDGLHLSLDIAKQFMSSEDIILYKKTENNNYYYFKNSSNLKYSVNDLRELIPKNKNIDDYLYIEINDKTIKRLSLLPIKTKNNQKYLILIVNSKLTTKEETIFIKIFQDTFKVILEKMEDFIKIKKISEKDNLTNIGNRLNYETEADKLNSENIHLHITYALIDLFRLKYVNDNINHDAGDKYIKKAAELLKKYFPEYSYYVDEKGRFKKIETGDYVYRIGGDEFVVISKVKNKEETEKLLITISNEIKHINLEAPPEIKKDLILGINYGITERKNNETILELYKESDNNLSKNKTEMYKKLRIDRRK